MTKATFSYSLIQASFWAIYGTVYCYSGAYLLSVGLTNTYIGIFMGSTVGLCSLGQIFFSALLNNNPQLPLTRFLQIMSGIMLLGSVALLFRPPRVVSVLLFLLLCFLLQLLPSFINSVGMAEIQQEVPINFGIGRGIGSFGYAVISILTGRLLTAFGNRVMFIVASLLSILFFLSVVQFTSVMRSCHERIPAPQAAEAPMKRKIGLESSFLRKYKRYAVFLIGVAVIMTGHTFMSNFLYQIIRFKGGNETSTGIAAAIAAFSEIPIMFGFVYMLRAARCDNYLRVSCVFLAFKLLLVFLASSIHMVYFAQICQMPGYALFTVCAVYYTGTVIAHEDVVSGQAYLNAASILGAFLSLILGGAIIDRFGVQALLLAGVTVMSAGAAVIFCAVQRINKTVGTEFQSVK
ncbi:hypothetical protein SDC9_45842 [bioreactor metagenome]|uniref:Major facilitator superfamily associated domain-containing protein n=1 Tax=bioreactor metagenome TaxID=1076179 RepID=A0A644W744_9ZZZZ